MGNRPILIAGRCAVAVVGMLILLPMALGDAGAPTTQDHGVAGGLITTFNNDSVTVQIDGDDAPTKFNFGPGLSLKALTGRHIYPVNRVNMKWKLDGDNKDVIAIEKVNGKASGVVIGTVIKVYDNFWVAVKPTNGGMIEGFALNGPAKAGTPGYDVLKALNSGDIVGIRYTTDFERHRIQHIEVKPAAGK